MQSGQKNDPALTLGLWSYFFKTDSVLRFDETSGTFLGVFASGPELQQPSGLVFGPDGNLYVASHGPNPVVRYDGTTGAFIDIF